MKYTLLFQIKKKSEVEYLGITPNSLFEKGVKKNQNGLTLFYGKKKMSEIQFWGITHNIV